MRHFFLFLLLPNIIFAKGLVVKQPSEDYFSNNEAIEVIDETVLPESHMLNLYYAFSHRTFDPKINFEYNKIDIGVVKSVSNAVFPNILFRNKQNQLMVFSGISFKNGSIESFKENGKTKYNLTYGGIAYAQSASFLKIPGRLNVELSFFNGREHGKVKQSNGTYKNKNFARYDQIAGGISYDFILGWKNVYFAPGLGVYMKTKNADDDRISSRLHFGVRSAVGVVVKGYNMEFFVRHFSNGSVTAQNSGQNFIGLAVGTTF